MNKYLQSFLKETNLKGEKGIKGESEKREKGIRRNRQGGSTYLFTFYSVQQLNFQLVCNTNKQDVRKKSRHTNEVFLNVSISLSLRRALLSHFSYIDYKLSGGFCKAAQTIFLMFVPSSGLYSFNTHYLHLFNDTISFTFTHIIAFPPTEPTIIVNSQLLVNSVHRASPLFLYA